MSTAPQAEQSAIVQWPNQPSPEESLSFPNPSKPGLCPAPAGPSMLAGLACSLPAGTGDGGDQGVMITGEHTLLVPCWERRGLPGRVWGSGPAAVSQARSF